MRTTLHVLGRMVFGGFFAYNGVSHFQKRQMMTAYAGSKGVPEEVGRAAVLGTGAMLVTGGLSIAMGVKPRLGLAAIVGFLVPVSLQMHRFWDIDDPTERTNEVVHFTKNIALAGAALALMQIREPWPVAIASGRTGPRGVAAQVSYPRFNERTLRALPA